ncbi:uncharacterized protein LOC105202736 [Solenopsis invicta]|uniref:uncharacterized protein LOC105202736 n=1 Tax=Solenopsis invicta TaxID=13686 RepID=UPI00193EA627|nr:uncharacterized protein LOC105202736 [Solenopsis invicta]
MPLVIIVMKTFFFFYQRKELLNMLKYAEDKFWYAQYDAHGSKLIKEINKRALILTWTFKLGVQATCISYVLIPLIGILNLNLHLQVTRSCAEEQDERKCSLSASFADFFYRICSFIEKGRKCDFPQTTELHYPYKRRFRLTVRDHADGDLMDGNRAIEDVAYSGNWQILSHKGRKVRKVILFIMMRSGRVCSIFAGGFFPVSLETFVMVVSIAASYFTLLHHFAE